MWALCCLARARAEEPAAPAPDAGPDAPPAAPAEEPPDPPDDEERAALERALAEQQAAIEDLRQQLAEVQVTQADEPPIRLAMEGHFRVRGLAFDGLWASADGGPQAYTLQRVWLRPRFDLLDGAARLWVEVRALDGVVLGDAGGSSTPLDPEEPTSVGADGAPVPVTVGRAWTELRLPVGALRVGRQPSAWGSGLLAATGDATGAAFGDASFPTTADRIQLELRPLGVAAAVLGRDDRGVPLFASIALDRIVEDPLALDPAGAPIPRAPGWWADGSDDLARLLYVLAWDSRAAPTPPRAELSGGVWVEQRMQADTDTALWVVDGAGRALVHHALVEAELFDVAGHTGGDRAAILGWAGRGGVVHDRWELVAELGGATGDADPEDDVLRAGSLHPDHNVGLLLYDEVLAAVTADAGRPSDGGVVASRYVFPTARLTPARGVDLLGGFVLAWPDGPDGVVVRCRPADPAGCDAPPLLQASDGPLGWEIDGALKARWAEDHLSWTLESAWARVTDRIPLERAGLDPSGAVFTVQSRVAWTFE